MNKSELKDQLKELNVDVNQYSLEGELLPDRIVLYHSYHEWRVFYLDERGNEDQKVVFKSEEEACDYIYNQFKELKQIRDKFSK